MLKQVAPVPLHETATPPVALEVNGELVRFLVTLEYWRTPDESL